MEEVLSAVRANMRGLRAPGHHEMVFKDECMFSFESPESTGGLYINLRTFQVCRASACLSCATLNQNNRSFEIRTRCTIFKHSVPGIIPGILISSFAIVWDLPFALKINHHLSPPPQCFGEHFVELDHSKTQNALYLHEKWTKVCSDDI